MFSPFANSAGIELNIINLTFCADEQKSFLLYLTQAFAAFKYPLHEHLMGSVSTVDYAVDEHLDKDGTQTWEIRAAGWMRSANATSLLCSPSPMSNKLTQSL